MSNDPSHEIQCRQVAAMVATGATQATMQEALKLSRYQVGRLVADPLTHRYVEEMGEEIQKTALMRIRQDIARMTGLGLKALEKNLKAGNMEAVKTLFRVAGALDVEAKPVADTNLTVILPGAKIEKVVEVTGEEYEDPAAPTTDVSSRSD